MKSKKHTRLAIIASAVLLVVVGGTAIVLGAGRTVSPKEPPSITIKAANTVTVIVQKDGEGKTIYSLFGGDVIPAPSELSRGRIFNDITELNAALAEYPPHIIHVRPYPVTCHPKVKFADPLFAFL